MSMGMGTLETCVQSFFARRFTGFNSKLVVRGVQEYSDPPYIFMRITDEMQCSVTDATEFTIEGGFETVFNTCKFKLRKINRSVDETTITSIGALGAKLNELFPVSEEEQLTEKLKEMQIKRWKEQMPHFLNEIKKIEGTCAATEQAKELARELVEETAKRIKTRKSDWKPSFNSGVVKTHLLAISSDIMPDSDKKALIVHEVMRQMQLQVVNAVEALLTKREYYENAAYADSFTDHPLDPTIRTLLSSADRVLSLAQQR